MLTLIGLESARLRRYLRPLPQQHPLCPRRAIIVHQAYRFCEVPSTCLSSPRGILRLHPETLGPWCIVSLIHVPCSTTVLSSHVSPGWHKVSCNIILGLCRNARSFVHITVQAASWFTFLCSTEKPPTPFGGLPWPASKNIQPISQLSAHILADLRPPVRSPRPSACRECPRGVSPWSHVILFGIAGTRETAMN